MYRSNGSIAVPIWVLFILDVLNRMLSANLFLSHSLTYGVQWVVISMLSPFERPGMGLYGINETSLHSMLWCYILPVMCCLLIRLIARNE